MTSVPVLTASPARKLLGSRADPRSEVRMMPLPYPPNTIEQVVNLIPGATYEFRMDAIEYRNSTTGNADIGTIWVELEGVEIARHAFGSYASPQQKRAEVCGR